MLAFFTTLLVAAVGLANAIPTISIKGSKFFTSDGKQFFVKGIAYQLVPFDPLVDVQQCTLDAALMKTLGANAIRVYHVDPKANHKPCMDAFAAAGIYAFIDLDTFDTQITQDKPTWTQSQLLAFQAVMDAFQSYDNVIGFFIGNEVITTALGSPAAPYVKAATKDLKSYRDSKGYRKIPVGYSAADIASLRPMLQNYLACGSDPANAIDFFSLNAYEWCGNNNYQTSGYSQLTANVTNYSIPIFFSETGCNTVPPRDFADQGAIFGPEMAPYWSGSIIYEWIEEANHYGIINYGPKVNAASPNAPPDGFPRSGTPIPVQPDFDNLKKEWSQVNPSGIDMAAYTATNTALPCPARTPGVWEVDPDATLPSLLGAAKAPTTTSSTNGTKGGATSGASSNKTSSSPTTITASIAGISATVSASTVAATTMALGTRHTISLVLLSALCWLTIGNVLML